MGKQLMSPISLIGSGALKEAGEELKKLGLKKGFIVISKALFEKGLLKNLTDIFDENSLEYMVYAVENINPDLDIIEGGIKEFSGSNCDFIISFGGRDTGKCAKGIAMGLKCYEENNSINCYINAEIPFATVVINSWINDDNSVYQYHHHKVKLNKTVNPFMVVIDSELIRNLPTDAMASVGIDSLTYSVEALVSTGATLISDTFAFEAIKILKKNLEEFIKGENSKEIREQLTYANYLANMAFNNIAVVPGQVERTSGFHTPAFDMEAIDTKMKDIAEILEIESKDEKISIGVMEEIKRLSNMIKVDPGSRKDESVIMY
ncbi:iron-containing alcohol dehydrogenase [uncultured Ilyobacter sp.]|uniref:iron-containing alcohol dehydrogenase n=1 Tax=uncultured Ilyobacter sp. TaxID=544433 RepID=UPI0029F4B89E|nr:iron-containing alcohol dehydrogenase [uncultured Ilyobacter sp.]